MSSGQGHKERSRLRASGGEESKGAAFFLLDQEPGPDQVAVITGNEARHLCRVLRLQSGDRVFATDGKGVEYELELVSVRPDKAVGRVLMTRVRPREPARRLVLAQSIIKPDRMAELVQSATQLGVSEIIPFGSARTVASLKPTRLEHLRRKVREAVKCSGRTVVPMLAEPLELSELLGRVSEFDAAVVAYEEEEHTQLADVLDPGAESVLLLVGPEGGFERAEVLRMKAAGIRSFSLGPRRLRAETAASAAVVLALSLLGELAVDGRRAGGPKVLESGA
ncbi:MAG: RsmE family RNA methyltransferase [candidate division WOR-3 bacterium]